PIVQPVPPPHLPLPSFPTRRSFRSLSHHPGPDFHGLSIDVRHHYSSAHHRGVCGTDEVQRYAALYDALEFGGLRSHGAHGVGQRSEEHTSELQSRENLVCSLLLEKK